MSEEKKEVEVKKEEEKKIEVGGEEKKEVIEDKKLKEYKKALEEKERKIKELEEAVKKAVQEKDSSEELKKILKKREEELKQKQLEEEKKLLKQKEEEIRILKLEKEINKFLKENPFLEDVLNEKVQDGTIKTVDDIGKVFSPTLIEKLKKAYELEEFKRKTGADPLGEFNEKVSGDIAENEKYTKFWEGIL